MVVFATGMALEEGDIADQGAQSIYAIWDPTTYAGELLESFDPFVPVTEGDLLAQSVVPTTAAVKDGITYYSITDNKIDWKIHRGWRLPMGAVHSGERSIADTINVSSSVLISSTVLQTPADPNLEMCTASAQPLNCVYILNGLEASARTSRSFDVVGDGKLDNYSVACIPEGGFSRGVSVVTRFTKTDGTPLPDETPPPPIGPPEDPQKPRDVPGPGAEPPPGSRPPGEGGSPCDEQRIDIFGTGNTPLDGGVTCPSSGWSRSQYQLSAPPAN